ncbi:MAG: tetratricopeptide repeat protein [Pseudomonadota bacterium]
MPQPSPASLLGAALLCVLLASTSALAETPDPPPEATIEAQLWDTYFGEREGGDPDAALATAGELERLTLKLHGPTSDEYGIALAELGISRLLSGDHDAAFADLKAAEVILKDELPIYSEKLIRALTFLASALQSRGRLEEALDAYTRAQHITHRLWGTGNTTQIPIAYAKADTLQALGRIVDAEHQYGVAWKLNRSAYGATSSQAIEAAARYGTWLRAMGEYDGAIALFHEALTEVQGDGPDKPAALPLLRGMAHAYRGGYRGKFARGMFRRIVRLMEREPQAFSVDQRIEARLAFGDWLMQRYFERDAVAQYEAAYADAVNAGPDGAHWLPEFEAPQLVRYGEMAPKDIGGEGRFVTFEFRVTDDGRIRNAKVVDTGAGSRDSSRARKQFPELSRFRPAIVDGKAQGLKSMTTTMYLLPDGVALEPEPVAAPARLTTRNAVVSSNWTMLRGDEVMTVDVGDGN